MLKSSKSNFQETKLLLSCSLFCLFVCFHNALRHKHIWKIFLVQMYNKKNLVSCSDRMGLASRYCVSLSLINCYCCWCIKKACYSFKQEILKCNSLLNDWKFLLTIENQNIHKLKNSRNMLADILKTQSILLIKNKWIKH